MSYSDTTEGEEEEEEEVEDSEESNESNTESDHPESSREVMIRSKRQKEKMRRKRRRKEVLCREKKREKIVRKTNQDREAKMKVCTTTEDSVLILIKHVNCRSCWRESPSCPSSTTTWSVQSAWTCSTNPSKSTRAATCSASPVSADSARRTP